MRKKLASFFMAAVLVGSQFAPAMPVKAEMEHTEDAAVQEAMVSVAQEAFAEDVVLEGMIPVSANRDVPVIPIVEGKSAEELSKYPAEAFQVETVDMDEKPYTFARLGDGKLVLKDAEVGSFLEFKDPKKANEYGFKAISIDGEKVPEAFLKVKEDSILTIEYDFDEKAATKKPQVGENGSEIPNEHKIYDLVLHTVPANDIKLGYFYYYIVDASGEKMEVETNTVPKLVKDTIGNIVKITGISTDVQKLIMEPKKVNAGVVLDVAENASVSLDSAEGNTFLLHPNLEESVPGKNPTLHIHLMRKKAEVEKVSIEVVPFVNGLKAADFENIDPKAFDCQITYREDPNSDTNTKFVTRNIEVVEGKPMFKDIPLNQPDVQIVSTGKTNAYGLKVTGVDNVYPKEDNLIFSGIEETYLPTSNNGQIAVNYELKYDLAINVKNADEIKDFEGIRCKLFDHNDRELDVEYEVKADEKQILVKGIPYNPSKASLKFALGTGKVLEPVDGAVHAKAKENTRNTFLLTPDFRGLKTEEGKNLMLSMDVKAVTKEPTKALNIPDKALRKAIYEDNKTNSWDKMWNAFPSDVDQGLKNEYYLYPSQIEYVKYLDIKEDMDATGVEVFTAVDNLKVRGTQNKKVDFTVYSELKYLDVSDLGLDQLDISGLKEIVSVKANNNHLTKDNFVFADDNKLEWLELENNSFDKGLDFAKLTNLKTLNLSDQKNKLTEIDVTPLTKLIELKLERHNLKSLDVSKNTELSTLSLDNDREDQMGLTEIDLSNNKKLIGIYLKENKLTSLQLEGQSNVAGLNIHGNAIRTLDLSKLTFNSSNSYFDDMQRITLSADEKKQVDMKRIVGAENLDRVIIDANPHFTYDKATGIVTFTDRIVNFQYKYDTRNEFAQKFGTMRVDVLLANATPETDATATIIEPIIVAPVIETTSKTAEKTEPKTEVIKEDKTPLSTVKMPEVQEVLEEVSELKLKDIQAKGFKKFVKDYQKLVKALKKENVSEAEIKKLSKNLSKSIDKYEQEKATSFKKANVNTAAKKKLASLVKKVENFSIDKYDAKTILSLFGKYEKAIKLLNNKKATDKQVLALYRELSKAVKASVK